jgi:hypothetical protein
MKPTEIAETIRPIPTWLSEAEKLRLAMFAQEVPAGGTIVEVGSLYGGSTALLALGQPEATVYAHDEFSWSPIAERPASAQEMSKNLKALGIENVRIVEGDSRITGKAWKGPIDLLWIDGGHSYEYVHADLENFGPWARRIVLHDWQNPGWASVTKAIMDFLAAHPEWMRGVVVDMLVELFQPKDE